MVLADVITELTSQEAAKVKYGVVIDPVTIKVDLEATAKQRKLVVERA